MKVQLSWLREFVDVPGTADDIATLMSFRGFAVEGIEPLPGDDAVIDFEVTANRPDCLSVVGIAREVATAYGLQMRRPAVRVASRDSAAAAAAAATDTRESPGLHLASLKPVERGDVDIAIEDPDLCPRYAGAVADVTVADSPTWLQARLRAAGVRPISNIVDITNYVLIELGQPMHAFDHARLAGGAIRVRRARAGETIRTLDGQLRELADDMLVIADGERPAAVAGVMGGAESEVSATTRTIVLESAYFKPSSIRRTSKRLGLKTEASTRFERGADPRLAMMAMERACALIEFIGAGKARGTVIDRYPSRIEPKVLRLRRGRISGLLGVEVEDATVRRILDSLGFAMRDAADGWDVTVPTRRVDVLREVDLIEEVARHNGFDRIPSRFPALETPPLPLDPRIIQARALRASMTAVGFSEAVTFGFVSAAAAAPFADPNDVVPIANPLSETFAVLRPSVIPGLLDAVAHNWRREQRDARLFEIGARFTRSRGEQRVIALAWTGSATGDHWSGTSRPVDFFDLKGVAEQVCDTLGVAVTASSDGAPWLAAGRAASLQAGGQRIGVLGQLAPVVTGAAGLPASDAVYVAEIDLDAVNALAATEFRMEPLPKFPSVTRDISILVDLSLPAESVRETVRSAAPPTLASIREFDRYHGKGVPEDKVSLSLRLVFRSADRTLTDAEVQQAMDAVMTALRDRHGAVQR